MRAVGVFEEKLRKKDKQAFEQLVRENQNKIYAVCLNMMKNTHDAQDAAQETFIKAYSAIGGFRGDSSVLTWLTKIAVRCCLDMLRKRKETVDIETEFDLASEETTESISERNRTAALVRKAVAELPKDMRIVIVLRDIEGLPYEEIGKILKMTEGTVKSRIFRAREKLRKILTDSGELF